MIGEVLRALGDFMADAGSDLHAALSDPWTLATICVVLATCLAVFAFSAAARKHHLPKPDRFYTLLAALGIAALAGASFHWTWLLPGVVLVLIGLLSMYGREFVEAFLGTRRVAASWSMHPWIAALTNPRNSYVIGLLCIALGIALLGGGLVLWLTALIFAVNILRRLVPREIRAWKSGDSKKYSPVFWQFPTTGVIAVVLFVGVVTGVLLDRTFLWIDSSPQTSQGPLVLQALIAVEVGVLTLGLAAIGLAIQLRASSFSAEIATSQLHRYRLAGVFLIVAASLVATVLTLGQWDASIRKIDGLIPSLVVHLSLLALVAMIIVTAGAIPELVELR